MKKETLSNLYAFIGAGIYCLCQIGLGLIFGTFWEISKRIALLYWGSTILVCLFMIGLVVLITFTKTDKGALGIQFFLTACLGLLPITVRLLGLIPSQTGIILAGIVAFLAIALYFFTMLSVAHYNTIEDNKNTWEEPKKEEKQSEVKQEEFNDWMNNFKNKKLFLLEQFFLWF